MSNFTSTLEEEILAVIQAAKWLEKHEAEFCIPPYYKQYLRNLTKRLTDSKGESND